MGVKVSKEHKAMVQEAQSTKKLRASGKELTELPPAFLKITAAEEVWLQNNQLTDVPEEFLQKLGDSVELFYCNGNQLSCIPSGMLALSSLEEFNISGNPDISCIPEEVPGAWKGLKQAYLNDLPLLTAVPSSVGAWTKLKVLHINNCGLTSLPDDVGQMECLTMVSLNDNQLESLPTEVGKWVNVSKLFLNNNMLITFPESMGQMGSLEKLYASHNKLQSLPHGLFAGSPLSQVLDELYLVQNELTSLPESVSECGDLGKLYVDDNLLEAVPADLHLLKSLEILHANNNKLTEVPECVGDMPNIKFIHVAGNSLTDLPSSLTRLQELRVFEVTEGNDLTEESLTLVEEVTAKLIPAWKF